MNKEGMCSSKEVKKQGEQLQKTARLRRLEEKREEAEARCEAAEREDTIAWRLKTERSELARQIEDALSSSYGVKHPSFDALVCSHKETKARHKAARAERERTIKRRYEAEREAHEARYEAALEQKIAELEVERKQKETEKAEAIEQKREEIAQLEAEAIYQTQTIGTETASKNYELIEEKIEAARAQEIVEIAQLAAEREQKVEEQEKQQTT